MHASGRLEDDVHDALRGEDVPADDSGGLPGVEEAAYEDTPRTRDVSGTCPGKDGPWRRRGAALREDEGDWREAALVEGHVGVAERAERVDDGRVRDGARRLFTDRVWTQTLSTVQRARDGARRAFRFE